MKRCARPPPPRKAQPRRTALTLRLAVASRSAFRPSIEVGMPPPSKASVRCVGQAGASWPLICALGIFIGAFHPALCPSSALARNMLGSGSVHLVRMVFIIKNGLWRRENAHFPPRCAGGAQRPLVITPTTRPKSRVTPVGRSYHWNLVPDRKKTCYKFVTTNPASPDPWIQG